MAGNGRKDRESGGCFYINQSAEYHSIVDRSIIHLYLQYRPVLLLLEHTVTISVIVHSIHHRSPLKGALYACQLLS